MRPPSAPARTSPARRRSVSRATRRRISSSATTATACCRISRSKSPRPPESRTITTQAWGGPPPGEITGWARARPATEGWAGTKGWPSPAWLERLFADRADRVGGELAAEAAPGEPLAAAVEDGDGAADGGGDRRRDFLQAALLEDQPLEPPLHGDAALQHLVLLVDEPGEGLLGDRDERRRVGHLEQREVALLGLVDQRFRQFGVAEAGAEAEPGEVAVGQQADEGALLGGAVERDAGGQHQLAAGEPRRRVLELGDVDPANRRGGRLGAGGEVEVELVEQALDGEQSSS